MCSICLVKYCRIWKKVASEWARERVLTYQSRPWHPSFECTELASYTFKWTNKRNKKYRRNRSRTHKLCVLKFEQESEKKKFCPKINMEQYLSSAEYKRMHTKWNTQREILRREHKTVLLREQWRTEWIIKSSDILNYERFGFFLLRLPSFKSINHLLLCYFFS